MAGSAGAREQWGSRTGFVLAAVGSAVGLGNMWRFSYLTAENGGAAFLVVYLALVALVGLPVMLAEFVVGRGAGKSPVGALGHFGGSRWKPLGALFLASGFLILSYYSVIAGWTLRYALTSIVGFGPDAGAHFERVATGPPAIARNNSKTGTQMPSFRPLSTLSPSRTLSGTDSLVTTAFPSAASVGVTACEARAWRLTSRTSESIFE